MQEHNMCCRFDDWQSHLLSGFPNAFLQANRNFMSSSVSRACGIKKRNIASQHSMR